jgi:hypothetical protein
MLRKSRPLLLAIAIAGAALTACGQPAAQDARPPAAAAATAPPPTAAPATVAPATAASATVAPAPPATAAVPAAPATTAPAAPAAPATTAPAAGPYADIPQGRTPEGYQLLGDPAAPVTLVMYSDFL